MDKLVDRFNNTYHSSISKKPIDVDYADLTEKIETNHKAPKFEVGDRVRNTMYKNIFSKCYTKNWSKEMFIIDFIWKTNHWTYKIKDLNEDKIIGSFYEKKLLLSKL